ncbi:MAG: glucose 1-dehydrogenase [Planctomycetes bacterium]|nr:glucose 1-dehydrogenase [Planctomycetota bacterium]
MGSSFAGRVVLVTGGTSGIGRALAVALGREGASVAVTGRRAELLEATCAAVREAGGRALAIVGDQRDEAHAKDAVERTVAAFGGLDVLVNNAGVIGSGALETTTTAEWDRIFDTDVKGPFFFLRAAIPHLKGRPGANIVNLGSVAGIRPYGNLSVYCAAKAALDELTECLALELAPHGVRVNSVNPGVVVTNLHKASNAVPDYDAFLERGKQTHPLGRVGHVDDVVAAILHLASDAARWVTGTHALVDGGRSLTGLR